MSDDFYRALEERFYAPREVIKALRQQYLGFIEPLRELFPGARVFDVGCGRGEWLELMLEFGFAPYGVDLDDGMLRSCVELGLPATKGDAIAYLGSLPDESHALVTAFHVVEHVSFEHLQLTVSNALRVLRAGGLLIMETPNVENLVVATHNFYLDPTHRRPLPAPLLAFLAMQAGFSRVATLRLQEAARIREGATPSLYEVLAGASPDIAIIAQKGGLTPELAARFDAAFAGSQGVGLSELADRYDAAVVARIGAATSELGVRLDAQQAAIGELAQTTTTKLPSHVAGLDARASASQAELRKPGSAISEEVSRQIAELGATMSALEAEVRQSASATSAQLAAMQAELCDRRSAEASVADELRQAATAQLAALQAERDALHASWSWRVTAPLRWATRPFMERAARTHAPSSVSVPAPLRPLVAAMKQILRDPQRSYHLNQRLMRYPALHKWLVGLSKRAGIYPGPPSTARFRDYARPHAAARGAAVRVSAATPSWARQTAGAPNASSDGAERPSVLAEPLLLTGRELEEVFEELRQRVLASSEAVALRQRAVSTVVTANCGRDA